MSSSVRKRSKILWQITALVVVIFIASSVVILVFNIRSTDKLIEKSKEKLIKSRAEDMSTTFDFITNQVAQEMTDQSIEKKYDVTIFAKSLVDKELNIMQVEANKILKDLTKRGVLGTKIFIAVLEPAPPISEKPMIILSNRDDLMFKEAPESIKKIYEGGKNYGFVKDGIPEFGLTGEQLVVYYQIKQDIAVGAPLYATGIRPLHEDLSEIDSYFNKEKKKTNIIMGIVVGLSLLAVVLVTFFVLRYLIRSKITQPVEELSSVAESVMEGDLDVEVSVKKGEEFESLKRAFNEMVKSIRDFMNRASGGE